MLPKSVAFAALAAVAAVAAVAALAWLWTPDRDLATLEATYLASPADMVEVAGTRLHVRDGGPRDAPAIVLIHGLGASLHTWERLAAGLSERYRVIRFDLPGSGLSPPDVTGDYTDTRSRALLAALMDRLGIAHATIVGHSIGGRIAWSFAAHRPDRVERLVLLAPDGFESPGFEYGIAPKVPALMGLMRYLLPRPALRANLAPAFADPGRLDDALLTRYHDLMLAPGARDAMLRRMSQTVLTDPVPWLQRIRAPTLLLWGEQDAMIPVANAADYTAAIGTVTLVRLPGVGHLPQEEAPERSLQALRAFLD
jgi:pimeloyl-ACP methyl ester carboxylesterase